MSTPSLRARLLWVGGALALSLAAMLGSLGPAQAQSGEWSEPRLVFEGEGLVDWPTLVADPYGGVHGLWVFRNPEGAASRQQVYYVRLDRANWQPVDIFSYRGAVSSLAAASWADGLLVTWNGSHYGQADTVAPDVSAKAWSGPYELGSSYFQPGLAVAPDGTLWMAYGSQADKGVYVQRLDRDTGAWSTPQLVAYAIAPNTAPDWTRLVFGPDGTLHVTWAEYQLPEGFPPVGLHYARSTDSGGTWTTPREVAAEGNNQPSITTGPNGEVYLSWVGIAGVGSKYVVESPDGGLTWNEPSLVMSQGGSQGSVNLAVDSAGTLHAVLANSGCVWHFFKLGEVWSPGECISEPLPTSALKEFPAMSLGLGNQLHVLFWTDRQQMWYTTRQLEAPAIAPLAVPTAVPATATVDTPTQAPAPTATYLPDLGPAPDLDASSRASTLSILAGIVPVALFFLIVGLVRFRVRK